jgi:hypothetical protein
MSNITMTEWKETEDRIAAEVARRWPWLVRTSPHYTKLRVETPSLTAGAELDRTGRDGSCTVRIVTHSSACISGGVADIAEHARQICEVRDAMLFIHGLTAGVTVWQDGECPCSWCGGKGKSRGETCSKCAGKGKV